MILLSSEALAKYIPDGDQRTQLTAAIWLVIVHRSCGEVSVRSITHAKLHTLTLLSKIIYVRYYRGIFTRAGIFKILISIIFEINSKNLSSSETNQPTSATSCKSLAGRMCIYTPNWIPYKRQCHQVVKIIVDQAPYRHETPSRVYQPLPSRVQNFTYANHDRKEKGTTNKDAKNPAIYWNFDAWYEFFGALENEDREPSNRDNPDKTILQGT